MSLEIATNFTISINMTSDWHIGSGSSRGEIDSAIQRDADHLPYIPAKTLNGILRDGCEQVALALDNGNKQGKWQNWVNFLFGSQPTLSNQAQTEIETPYPAALKIHSAFLSDSLRNSLQNKQQLKSAIAFMKPGVAIDPETGSAKSNNLRFEEVVRMGAILKSENCTLDFSGYPKITDDEKKVAFALLIAGTKLIDRIGGKRRRGNGKCEITISDIQRDDWLEWLRENYTKISDPPKWEQPKLDNNSNYPEVDSNWLSIPLTITTLSPVVIPKRTVGNVVECLDYIPGRYFLGHLHQQLGKVIDVKSAIAQSHFIITNATIAINDSPSRPTPFCLFGEKLDGGLNNGKGVYNRFQEAEPQEVQLKGERSGYVSKFEDTENSELPQYKTVKLEVNTHNTIDDNSQRPSPETGGAVYSYQAIPSNTTFKAELRLPKSFKDDLDKEFPNWIEALNANLRIGQSKKDQYGLVCLKTGQPQPLQSSKSIKNNQPLYVWLLSDVLLRDKRLNPTTDPDDFKRELETQLEIALEERPSNNDELLSIMARSRRTESWQVRWGLPRPSLLGLQAGSCFVYQIQDNQKPAPEKLAELEAKGIGERRVEGYGQICFNDPLLKAKLKPKKREDSASPPSFKPMSKNSPLISPDDPSFNDACTIFNYARTIETAAWRDAIEKKALAIAASREKRQEVLGIKIDGEESHPSMSQLGGLRSTLRRLQSLPDQNQVTSWIEAIKKVSNRKEKWDKTDDGLKKIRELVTNDQKIWQALNIASLDELTITVGGRNELKQILWAEAVRTLVDAMIRAHKRDLEKVQRQKAE